MANAEADIALKTVFKGHEFTRDLLLSDARFAEKLASRLKEHVGKTIAELADIPIEF